MIYHITSRKLWEEGQVKGFYVPEAYAEEGFIHASTAQQVEGSANKFFKGQSDLVLLYIDETKVKPKLIFENLMGGSNLYPHIYGHLNLDAIVRVVSYSAGPDGVFRSPFEL